MKKHIILIPIMVLMTAFMNCNSPKPETSVKEEITEVVKEEAPKRQFPNALDHGKIFEKEGKKYMYGGEDATENFDVTNSILKDENFHFGIGREAFDALIHPEYISMEEAEKDSLIPDSERFLVLQIGNEVRAYGVDLLTHHEIVNDVIEGQPIMAAYCVLADLGAIYDRTLGGKVFTFGLSGYTYHDDEVWDGVDGFVFWDRETESTWWPLIGKAVSGPMLEIQLIEHDKTEWEDITWGELKTKYKNALILKAGQTMEPPKDWKKLTEKEIEVVQQKLIAS